MVPGGKGHTDSLDGWLDGDTHLKTEDADKSRGHGSADEEEPRSPTVWERVSYFSNIQEHEKNPFVEADNEPGPSSPRARPRPVSPTIVDRVRYFSEQGAPLDEVGPQADVEGGRRLQRHTPPDSPTSSSSACPSPALGASGPTSPNSESSDEPLLQRLRALLPSGAMAGLDDDDWTMLDPSGTVPVYWPESEGEEGSKIAGHEDEDGAKVGPSSSSSIWRQRHQKTKERKDKDRTVPIPEAIGGPSHSPGGSFRTSSHDPSIYPGYIPPSPSTKLEDNDPSQDSPSPAHQSLGKGHATSFHDPGAYPPMFKDPERAQSPATDPQAAAKGGPGGGTGSGTGSPAEVRRRPGTRPMPFHDPSLYPGYSPAAASPASPSTPSSPALHPTISNTLEARRETLSTPRNSAGANQVPVSMPTQHQAMPSLQLGEAYQVPASEPMLSSAPVPVKPREAAIRRPTLREGTATSSAATFAPSSAPPAATAASTFLSSLSPSTSSSSLPPSSFSSSSSSLRPSSFSSSSSSLTPSFSSSSSSSSSTFATSAAPSSSSSSSSSAAAVASAAGGGGHPPFSPVTSVSQRSAFFGLSQTLAKSLMEEPIIQYLFPEEDGRLKWLTTYTRNSLDTAMARKGLVAVAGGDSLMVQSSPAIVVAYPPHKNSSPRAVLNLTFAARGCTRARLIADGIRIQRELERHHLKEDHWFVAALAVARERRGEGLASSLLAAVIARADAEYVPVAATVSDLKAVHFFSSWGFRPKIMEVADEAPTAFLLVRQAKKDPRKLLYDGLL